MTEPCCVVDLWNSTARGFSGGGSHFPRSITSKSMFVSCRLHGYGGFAWDREFDRQKEQERELLLNASPQAA